MNKEILSHVHVPQLSLVQQNQERALLLVEVLLLGEVLLLENILLKDIPRIEGKKRQKEDCTHKKEVGHQKEETVEGGLHLKDMMKEGLLQEEIVEEDLLMTEIVQGDHQIQEDLLNLNMVGEGLLMKEKVEEDLPCIAQGDLQMVDTTQILETMEKDLQMLETGLLIMMIIDKEIDLAVDKDLPTVGEDLLMPETVQEDLQNVILAKRDHPQGQFLEMTIMEDQLLIPPVNTVGMARKT